MQGTSRQGNDSASCLSKIHNYEKNKQCYLSHDAPRCTRCERREQAVLEPLELSCRDGGTWNTSWDLITCQETGVILIGGESHGKEVTTVEVFPPGKTEIAHSLSLELQILVVYKKTFIFQPLKSFYRLIEFQKIKNTQFEKCLN